MADNNRCVKAALAAEINQLELIWRAYGVNMESTDSLAAAAKHKNENVWQWIIVLAAFADALFFFCGFSQERNAAFIMQPRWKIDMHYNV